MQETPVEATHWGRWARQLPLPAEFTVLVAPPLVGGVVVGSLRALTQFDKPGVAAGSSPPSASNPLKVYLDADSFYICHRCQCTYDSVTKGLEEREWLLVPKT